MLYGNIAQNNKNNNNNKKKPFQLNFYDFLKTICVILQHFLLIPLTELCSSAWNTAFVVTITRPHLVDVTAHYLFLIGSHCLSSLCVLQQALPLQPHVSKQHRTRRLCLYTWVQVFWGPVPSLFDSSENWNENFNPWKCKGRFKHFTSAWHTCEYTWRPLSLTNIPWARAVAQGRVASWWPLAGQPPSPFQMCQHKVLVFPLLVCCSGEPGHPLLPALPSLLSAEHSGAPRLCLHSPQHCVSLQCK